MRYLYDIKNKDDLKELLKIKVCALLDYLEYSKRLDDLLEMFDESIEHYSTSTWLSFTLDGYGSDELLKKCYDSTRKASDNFNELVDRTTKEVLEVLNAILNSREDIQIYILGFSLNGVNNINEKLRDAVEDAYEIEYEYNMEEAFEKFKKFLKNYLFEEKK